MPEPTDDDVTSVTKSVDPITQQMTEEVTKFSDKTRKQVVSKEIRMWSEKGDWDHYAVRYFTDYFNDDTFIQDTSHVSEWSGNVPKKQNRTIKVFKRLQVQFPAGSILRLVEELKIIISIDENGTITETVITDNHIDGSPSAGITIPIAPPGPPQAWVP